MRDSDASVVLPLIVCFGFASLPVAAGAQQSAGIGGTTTIACSEQTTRIDGIGQRVRLTGECRNVAVSGSGNRVVVERVGSLTVSGMDNQVSWERSLQGDAPRVVTSGIKNVVTRATPAGGADRGAGAAPPEKPRTVTPAPPPPSATPASPPTSTTPAPPPPGASAPTTGIEVAAKGRDRLVVTQSGETLRLDCTARQVSVSGSTNTITLSGACGQVSVTGSGNKITVERTTRIVTTGHNNEIMWQHGAGDQEPAVRNSGKNNIVRRVTP